MEDKQIFEMWELFKSLLNSTGRPVKNLIDWLDTTDFKFAPASTQYHNSFRGGLLKHSLDVYYHMYDFKSFIDLFEIPNETIIITSLLHDICKVQCYDTAYRNVKNEQGDWIKTPYYTFNEKEALGHGDKSVMLMYEYDLKPTKLERAMIRNHMGFSNGEDERRVSKLYSQCPQALILHWADECSTWITESTENNELHGNYKIKLLGRNISESLQMYEQQKQYIQVGGTTYKLAPQDALVDDKTIIFVKYNNIDVKVYSPHGDGLPF